MGVRRNFCVDVYAEVSLCVELYEYVEVYAGTHAGFCVDGYVYLY